jgi:hypothetical protein
MVYPTYGTLGTLPLSLSQPPPKRAETKKEDPTVIPGTSYLGFLSRFGRKGMKYKPSAANLQEHPQRGRRRSATDSSLGDSGDSLRSRGEIWPSEDEIDDAVVLGDDGWERGLGLGLETPTRGFFRVQGLRGERLGDGLHQERGYSSAPTSPLLGSRSGSSSPRPQKRGKRGKEREPQMRQVSAHSVRSAQTVLVRTPEAQVVVVEGNIDD